MKPILKSNKGISNLIAYALLISLTLSISALVYGWLEFMIPEELPSCPEKVNIIVKEYTCTPKTSVPNSGSISMIIQNKGMFNVSGFFIRASDNVNSTFGIKELGKLEKPLTPGQETETLTFNYGGAPYNLKNLTTLEVQPFIDNDKERLLCQTYTVMSVNCTNFP